MRDSQAPLRRNLYGRRAGHALRPAQRERFDRLMPSLGIGIQRPKGDLDLASLFGNACSGYALEIGFGSGEHLVAMALAQPQWGFIGAEYYINGIASALYRLEQAGFDDASNVRLYQGDARDVMDILPPSSLVAAYILFPDPWPKKRQWQRRIISHETLNHLACLIVPGGRLHIASDHPDYQPWIMRHVRETPYFSWQPTSADDWRCRPDDWPATRYEQKALRNNQSCLYWRITRNNHSLPPSYISG